MKFIDLIEAYFAARKNKRRSKACETYEINWQANLVKLFKAISTHSVEPTAYAFVVTKPRPREVFACDMDMRIIHHYIDMRIRPLLEKKLTKRTFNNRIGYGLSRAIDTAIRDIHEVSSQNKDCWLIKLDLQAFFPNASQQVAFDKLSKLIEEEYFGDDKEDLLYLLKVSIFFDPHKDCVKLFSKKMWEELSPEKSIFNKPPGIGAPIGFLIGQDAMNYYLNDIDHGLIDECCIRVVRFADDMLIVTDNKQYVLNKIPELRKRLADIGCTLHPKKFYCQHYTKGVEFLGVHIKPNKVHVNNRIIQSAKLAIKKFNSQKVKDPKAFQAIMNSYFGMLKSRSNFGTIKYLVSMIDSSWWENMYFNEKTQSIQIKRKKKRYVCKKKGIRSRKNTSSKYNRG